MTFAKRKVLWIGLAVLCTAVIALVVIGAGRDPVEAGTWKESDRALGSSSLYKDPIEELTLTLKSSGFTPAKLNPHGKKFLLSLDNRADVSELVLRMTRKDGSVIREIRVPGGSGDWSELFELPPGSYKFAEVNYANWSCTIVVSE
jgi:hypothetical protein